MHLNPESTARQEQEAREPLQPQELKEWMSEQERKNAETLVELTGRDATLDYALTVLRKHAGDMEKAADAIFSGVVDDPEEREREAQLASIKQDFGHMFPEQKQPRANAVIDLTGEDDPFTDTRFRATTRSPDPSWQMVRTNEPVKSADDELNEVIQASLNDFAAEDSEVIPPEDMGLREGGRPIALRADVPGKAYAALVIQALFHVPQVRQRCSKLRLHTENPDGGKSEVNPGNWALWELLEMFTALDLGDISVFLDLDLLASWETAPLQQTDSVGALSKVLLEKIITTLQHDLDEQQIEEAETNRLFHFRPCTIHSPVVGPPQVVLDHGSEHIVALDITLEAPSNSLVPRLAETLNTYHDNGTSDHTLIAAPSEMVTFQINVSAASGAAPEPLVFPKSIYMDEFLAENLDLANETRAAQRQIQKDVEVLAARKRLLTRYDGQDTLENIRGSIEYYETVADCSTPERLELTKYMSEKFKGYLKSIEEEVQEIDDKLVELQAEIEALLNNPELQCHPYDLRAVLVHTGLPGRKHIYSYVQDKGTWWKTVDYTVTEVPEETVLNDPAGLHLGAGPYMLMYSRRLSEAELSAPVNWPPRFTELVLKNNQGLRDNQAAQEREGDERVAGMEGVNLDLEAMDVER
ncbi:hypothetical protein B0H15DRAFT_899761 [Mycena belliarum]|uniref:USP domain-containing protein n=1 Tax=Mycena belliarum TaxID=1033014 RepID=A0AAD6UEJ7_9AGAR|nr:hypothetical protein B0H15DRAFT_899761 [Mycena belliae]